MRRLLRLMVLSTVSAAMVVAPAAQAFHFYRGPAQGCTPKDGELYDPGTDLENPPVAAAAVTLGHNSYHDSESGGPVTQINVGESVRWTWNSSHCHSVGSATFDSGFHYPTQAPDAPEFLPGIFHYPFLDFPTLAYTHTFTAPGIYNYACVHHGVIGMHGIVIVE